VSTFKGRAAVFALWFLPSWIVRWLPPSFRETVEREVFDGLTRAAWFEAQVREIQAANMRNSSDTKRVEGGPK
jgi:hypothetical protein